MNSGRLTFPARGAVLTGCLIAIALALVNGFDRLSADRPGAARWVPAPFASESHLARARIALDRGDPAAARNHAEAAVTAAPLDPASSATLGAARLAQGDRSGGEAAMRVAGQLGWRIFYTQAYLVDRALALGDYRVATLRLDALVRQDPQLLHRRELLDPFERNPAGQAALAERLTTAPWGDAYASDVEGVAPDALRQRAEVLGLLAARGLALGCETIAPTIEGLISLDSLDQAAKLWRGHCPAASGRLIYDGDLSAAKVDYDRSAFAWSFVGQSDVSMVLTRAAGGGQQLVVDSTARRQALFMRQLLIVPPGRYRLTWREQSDAEGSAGMVTGQVFCPGAPETLLAGSFDSQTRLWSATVNLDGACAAHWLGFAVKPGPARFTLSSIALEPMR